jgi:Protease inhibitor Inh
MTYRCIAGAGGLMLANCVGGGLPGSVSEVDAAKTSMAGRWMLSAPNAPICGMAFSQSANADSGNVTPEGGCPGNFYTSRRWTFEQGGLSIKTEDYQPLAQLSFTDGGFAGQSTAGTPISLTRPVIPTAR